MFQSFIPKKFPIFARSNLFKKPTISGHENIMSIFNESEYTQLTYLKINIINLTPLVEF